MSRRHASQPRLHRRLVARAIGVSIAAIVVLTAALPGSALAQPGEVKQRDLESRPRWQLLQYRDANDDWEEVPPGIGTTMIPIGENLQIEAACSNSKTKYVLGSQSITIQEPEIERFECEPVAQAVDDAFYGALDAAASISLEGDIWTIYDAVQKPVLRLTGAQIPKDPTIARWELARIGDADGSIDQIRGVAPELEFLRGGVGNRGLSGRVVGSTGCGSFLGSYETDDSTMTANGIDYRLGECTEELARQAENVMDTLRDVTRFDVLPAGLALGDDAGNTRLALVPKIDLGERIWTPIEILGADGQPIAIDPSRFTTSVVQFIGRSVEGRSYCRNFEGSVISSGLALSTSPIKPDESQRCSDKIGKKQESDLDVENAFIGALEATSSHALRGDELELLDRNGEAVMRLVPQADLVGPTWVLSSYDPFPRRRGKQTVSGEAPTATFSGLGIIKGETGAFDANGADDYTAFFTTPGAAQIKVERPRVTGTACRGGGKKRQKQCVQEAAFLELLGRATGYIVRDSDLRLLEGPDTILTFVPLASDSGELE